MSKRQVMFKNPDLIFDIVKDHLDFPADEDDVTPRMESAREAFLEKFFQYGDYGRIEIDTKTMECRIIPRSEWEGR